MPRNRDMLEPLGSAVREARERAGVSQRELARRTGLNHKTISNIENGKTDPSYTVLVQICGTLGVGLNELVSGPADR